MSTKNPTNDYPYESPRNGRSMAAEGVYKLRDLSTKAGTGIASAGKNVGKKTVHASKGVFSEFKTFINKGNVVALATGLVMGAGMSLNL